MPAVVEEKIQNIDIYSIRPSDLNRYVEDNESLEQLALSIHEEGLIQPIVIRPLSDSDAEKTEINYEIVVGERRWRACKKNNMDSIPAIVRDIDSDKAHTDRLIENLQREDVPPLEQSEGVSHLLKRFDNDASEVAKRLGVSESWIYLRARLHNLSADWQTELVKPDTDYEDIKNKVTYQEEIARLPLSTQKILLDSNRLMYLESLDDLKRIIGKELHRISDKPWPEKFEKSSSKNCSNCDKRSDSKGNMCLFADLNRKEDSYCLDVECWQNKTFEWLEKVYKQTLKRDSNALIVVDYTVDNDTQQKWEKIGKIISNFNINLEEPEAEDLDDYDEKTVVFVYGDRIGQTAKAWIWIDNDEDDEDTLQGSQPEVSEEDIKKEKIDYVRREAMFNVIKFHAYVKVKRDGDEEGSFEPGLPVPPIENLLKLIRLDVFESFNLVHDNEEINSELSGKDLDDIWQAVCESIDEMGLYNICLRSENNINQLISLVSADDSIRDKLVSECTEAAEDAEKAFLESKNG